MVERSYQDMRKSSRIAALGIAVVALLAIAMVLLAATIGQSSAETARRIGTALGSAIGALGAFFLGWWYLLRRSGQ
jgi:Kef-type K+ transport system membrane component KefB